MINPAILNSFSIHSQFGLLVIEKKKKKISTPINVRYRVSCVGPLKRMAVATPPSMTRPVGGVIMNRSTTCLCMGFLGCSCFQQGTERRHYSSKKNPSSPVLCTPLILCSWVLDRDR